MNKTICKLVLLRLYFARLGSSSMCVYHNFLRIFLSGYQEVRDIAEFVLAQEGAKQIPHGEMMNRLVHVARHIVLNRRQYIRFNDVHRFRC